MATVNFVSHAGDIRTVHVVTGTSVMQAAVNEGLDAVMAECGGCCTCATCHVYVDETWSDRLPPASSAEVSLLECVAEPRSTSRLSCQVSITDDLDGLVIHLPESQF